MKVRVTIHDDMGRLLHDRALDVSDMLVRDAAEPIDFPTPDAGAASAFCTPPTRRQEVLEEREKVAKVIASEMLRFFAARDMRMGYPMGYPMEAPDEG